MSRSSSVRLALPRRQVCIHGHFYQPPRENPWTGLIERQESAGNFHDWNERIAAECYVPNTEARVVGPDEEVLKRVNNYSWISFNFGPTLMMWLEKSNPKAYEKIIAADQESFLRLNGHGNAIAQAFVHLILPLADPRDQKTVIHWGISDFKRRFGRAPEALWLPETACDDQVLKLLIDFKMKYAILAPSQAERVRLLAPAGPWKDVSEGSIDPKRPYRWFDPSSERRRFIDLFFYDGPISAAVSFEKLMSDSKVCADRIIQAFGDLKKDGLVSIATDGELYGHHHKFAEMGLAYLVDKELPSRKIEVVNYGYFLSRRQTEWEVEIKAGPQGLGTSWSCSHGVGRWFLDCGCGSEGKSQKWRTPLRQALNVLKSRLDGLTDKAGEGLFKDVWAAREDYGEIIGEDVPQLPASFTRRHLLKNSPSELEKARQLMEIQKFALYMFTSCGWFFSDIAGLEATQNLKYARRAMEIAREISGEDFELEFLEILAQALGNDLKFPDGKTVYQNLVRQSV